MQVSEHASTGVHPDRLALIAGDATSPLSKRAKHPRDTPGEDPYHQQTYDSERLFDMPPTLRRAKSRRDEVCPFFLGERVGFRITFEGEGDSDMTGEGEVFIHRLDLFSSNNKHMHLQAHVSYLVICWPHVRLGQ